jgi:hypothetical protein
LANCQRSYWYISGVNDTGNAKKTCITGVIDTGEVGDVYFTPAMHALPLSLTPANACFAGVNDTGEAL